MEFTKIEYQIIEFLSMHPGQVFDKERIYAQVCGYDAEGDSRTITELVRRIRKKIADYSEKEYIETVWGIGYRWKNKKLVTEKTILLYFVISLTAAFLLSGFTVHFARNMQNKIWENILIMQIIRTRFSNMERNTRLRYQDLINRR